MEKNIKVEDVNTIKEGNTDGRDWTIYRVKCSGDPEMNEFTTFEDRYANSMGQQMRDNFIYDEKYKTWKIVSKKQAEESTKHEELLQAIRFTAEQNKKIIEKLEAITNFFLNKNEKNL